MKPTPKHASERPKKNTAAARADSSKSLEPSQSSAQTPLAKSPIDSGPLRPSAEMTAQRIPDAVQNQPEGGQCTPMQQVALAAQEASVEKASSAGETQAGDAADAQRPAVGQRLSVFWEDDDDWYNGTVKAYKGGLVHGVLSNQPVLSGVTLSCRCRDPLLVLHAPKARPSAPPRHDLEAEAYVYTILHLRTHTVLNIEHRQSGQRDMPSKHVISPSW
jgi:hypothetical protein